MTIYHNQFVFFFKKKGGADIIFWMVIGICHGWNVAFACGIRIIYGCQPLSSIYFLYYFINHTQSRDIQQVFFVVELWLVSSRSELYHRILGSDKLQLGQFICIAIRTSPKFNIKFGLALQCHHLKVA